MAAIEPIFLPETVQLSIKVEPIFDFDEDSSDSEKIGEVFRVKNNHFMFSCVQCNEKFRLYDHFVHHIDKHWQETLSSHIVTSVVEPKVDIEVTEVKEFNTNKELPTFSDVTNDLHDPSWSDGNWDDFDRPESPDEEPTETPDELPTTSEYAEDNKAFRCDKCNKYFLTARIMRKHMKIHTEKGAECPICGRKFAIEYYVKGHMKNVHGERLGYSCTRCDARFEYPNQYHAHTKTHRDSSPEVERGYECHYCHKTFEKMSDCFKHLDALHWNPGVRKLSCSGCGNLFKSKLSLRKHVKSCGQDRPSLFKCKLCADSFVTNRLLMEHTRAVHPAGERIYKCSKCGMEFTNRRKKKYHMENHRMQERIASNNYLQCPRCPKKFARTNTLEDHMLKHEKDKTFECEICHKRLCLRYKKAHMERHVNVKNFQCAQCGKQFVVMSSLKVHMRWHATERKFQCEMCPKNYKTPNALTIHMQSHTGAYKYVCQVCGHGFSWRASLKKHSVTAHGQPLADDAAVAHFSILESKNV